MWAAGAGQHPVSMGTPAPRTREAARPVPGRPSAVRSRPLPSTPEPPAQRRSITLHCCTCIVLPRLRRRWDCDRVDRSRQRVDQDWASELGDARARAWHRVIGLMISCYVAAGARLRTTANERCNGALSGLIPHRTELGDARGFRRWEPNGSSRPSNAPEGGCMRG